MVADTKDVHLYILKHADMENNADIKADARTKIQKMWEIIHQGWKEH